MESCGRAGLQRAAGGGGCWVLVEARLHGGAPWGFTVQGGLEHNEPLIISKVEEGGKVEHLLQVGDELVLINQVELTGSRQEAVALVKGSYKTLQLTVRRDLHPGFIEEFAPSCSSAPAPPPSPPLAAQQQPSPVFSHQSRPAATGGVQLRVRNRRNEPASRPHSWHSTKLGEGQQDIDPDTMDTGSGWPHGYHPSASTTDLSSGFDSGTYLRKSPDQYSSRGSMESLDHSIPSQHHPGAQHHPYSQGGAHPAYSSCQQLSYSRSSNSIDHLHSKRDSAYSSFSTSSSIPEYLASTPTFSPQRSCSLEAVSQRGGSAEMQQAGMHHVPPLYADQQRRVQELSSASHPRSRGPAAGLGPDLQAGGVCYRGNGGGSSCGGGGVPASNRHSVGPIWGPALSCSSYENLKGAPAPPRRSDSYAALRNHDRPNSWSSLEHARSLRSLQKGSWHHSSGPVASGPAKGSYGTEGQLHTVMEKSPESSPTTRPRQGGGPPQSQPPSGHSPTPTDLLQQPGKVLLPLPQAHCTQVPCSSSASAGVDPVPAQDGSQQQQQQSSEGRKDGEREERRDGGLAAPQNSYQHFPSSSPASAFAATQLRAPAQKADRASVKPVLQAPPTSTTQPHPLHLLGDSAAPQHQQWERELHPDREHPLTRLELALAEVQQCSGSESDIPVHFHDNGSAVECGHAPTRSLSVLEKVSRFERRERAGKQRSHSSCNAANSLAHLRATENFRSITGTEDLRNMLERSNGGAKVHRSMSYRGGSSEHLKHRSPADPSLALQRSRSTLQLKEAPEAGGRGDGPWEEDIRDMLGHMQDSCSNRSYRDSLKDAQSKVLRSTSFRRRDLSSSAGPPGPPVSSNPQPSSVPIKHHQDRKGPKTLPKPQGVLVPFASPHTPKERHVVSPEVRGPSPPALPSVPPVGPSLRTRICGRKRLGAEQKKRSYSEPDKMNEIGVSDPETAALYRRGGETSVADRRKMFELAASRATNGPLQSSQSRPDLRQAQHDALAQYVVRKKGLKRGEGSRRSGPRPRSAYLPPESSHSREPVASYCLSDTASVSSSSSLHSLQEPPSFSSGEVRLPSSPPPGADLRSFQSNLFYPGRVSSPRPPALPQPSSSFGSPPGLQDKTLRGLLPEAELNQQNQSPSWDAIQVQVQVQQQQQNLGVSKELSGALQRAQSIRDPRKSASTEDLLERSEDKPMSPQHQRSRSSPTEGWLNQDLPTAAMATMGAFLCAAADSRLADMHASGEQASQQPSQDHLTTVQAGRPFQEAQSAVTRRQRPRRSSERQRGGATSTLAASVGLRHPLSPAGTGDVDSADWHAAERLSQVNLDAIVFPGVLQTGSSGEAIPAGPRLPLEMDRRSPDRPISESSPGSSTQQHPEAGVPPEDSDEVFFQNLPCPSPPESLVTGESSMEDSPPPPPPPPDVDQGAAGSRSSPLPPSPPSSFHSPLGTSLPSDVKPQPPSVTSEATPMLALEYQPLPRREKTCEDLRVEALARQLVSQDSSLAPLVDMFGVKSTVELMEEVFTPNSRLGGKSPWQRRGSRYLIQDGVCDSPHTHTQEPDQTEDEDAIIILKKVELCEALRSSVAALQQERELLVEEQRHHRALGGSIESLVQERLKANEQDKYSMFVGDLERIVNLLLSLCSRLRRIDMSLLALERDELLQEVAAEERDSLLHKRSLLLLQADDAQELKENLERRQRVVQALLCDCLTQRQLQDYRSFVSATPSLLTRQRHLDNLIRHREEQLLRLADSLPRELVDAHGASRGRLFSLPSPAPCPFPPSSVPGSAHPVRSTAVTSL